MSDEWTANLLKVHYDSLLAELDVRYQQRYEAQSAILLAHIEAAQEQLHIAFDAAQLAIAKAEQAQEQKNYAQNEFRQTLTDQAGTFMTREMAEQRIKEQGAELNRLQAQIDRRVSEAKDTMDSEMDGLSKEVTDLTIAITTKLTYDSYNRDKERTEEDIKALTLGMVGRVKTEDFREYIEKQEDNRIELGRARAGYIIGILLGASAIVAEVVIHFAH